MSESKKRPVAIIDWVRGTNGRVEKNAAGEYEKRVVDNGVFHGFGFDFEEFESGAGNYSVAIVELSDGTVTMQRADMIKFLDVQP